MKFCHILFYYTVLILVLNFNTIESIPTCVSQYGSSVDWWFIRKLPNTHRFIYVDSESTEVVLLNRDLKSPNEPLGATLQQITNNGNYKYIFFNDEAWSVNYAGDPTPLNPNYGKLPTPSTSKGIILYEDDLGVKKGVHIKHSLPGFPIAYHSGGYVEPSDYYHWLPVDSIVPMTGYNPYLFTYGNSFLCHTFDNLSTIANAIGAVEPNIYRHNVQYELDLNEDEDLRKIFRKFGSVPPNFVTASTLSASVVTSYAAWHSLGLSNLHIQLSLKETIHSVTTINANRLPLEFINKFSFPSELSSFESGSDLSRIGFNQDQFCLGDKHSEYDKQMIVCITSNNQHLITLLNSMIISYTTCEFETCVKNSLKSTSFSGKIFFDVPSILYNNETEIIVGNILLPNTKLKITTINVNSNLTTCSTPQCLESIGEISQFQTDANSYLSFTKPSDRVQLEVILHDYSTNLTILKDSNQIASYIANNNENPAIYKLPYNKVVDIYVTLQKLIKLNSKLPRLNLTNIVVLLSTDETSASIQWSESFPPITIQLEPFLCYDSLFRSFSYFVLSQLGYTQQSSEYLFLDNHPDVEKTIDVIDDNETRPFLKAILNVLSMLFRDVLYPSMNDRFYDQYQCQLRGFPQVTNSQHPLAISPTFNEWMITSFLWKTINNPVYTNPKIDIPKHSQSLIPFLLNILSPSVHSIKDYQSLMFVYLDDSWDEISKKNQIQHFIREDCQESCVGVQFESNNPSLNVLTSHGVCIESLDYQLFNDSLNRWFISQNLQDPFYVVNNYFYDFNQIYSELNVKSIIESEYFKQSVGMDFEIICKFKDTIISSEGIIYFTEWLNRMVTVYTSSKSYGLVDSYFIPFPQQESSGMVILKYENKFCNCFFSSLQNFTTGYDLRGCEVGPIVTSILPLNGGPGIYNAVTVKGRNLGTQFGLDFSLNILNETIPCDSITYGEPGNPYIEQRICKIPNTHIVQEIAIPNLSPLKPETSLFKYQYTFNLPTFNQFTNPIATHNQQVTLTGSNFFVIQRNSPDNSQVQITDLSKYKLFVGNNEVTIVSGKSHESADELVFIGNGTGINNQVTFFYNEYIFKTSLNVAYKQPVVNSILFDPSASTTRSFIKISIGGNSFGAYDSGEILILVADEYCSNVKWYSDSEISCEISQGFGVDLPVKLYVSGQEAQYNVNNNFTFDGPIIHQIVHAPLRTFRENYFYIVGTNFGTKFNLVPTVFIDNTTTTCTFSSRDTSSGDDGLDNECVFNRTYYNDNDEVIPIPNVQPLDYYDPFIDIDSNFRDSVDFDCIKCVFFIGVGDGFNISVSTLESLVSNSITLHYTPPTITNLTLTEGPNPTSGGANITIWGTDFLPNELLISGERVDYSIYSYSNEVEYNSQVQLFLEGNTEDIYNWDEYTLPENETSTFDLGVIVNNITMIYFENSTLLFNYTQWINSSLIITQVPKGIGKNHSITLFIGGQEMVSNTTFTYSYDAPNVTNVNSSNTTGGSITISGLNFVPIDVDPNESNVLVNNENCTDIQWINDNQIICNIKPGIGMNLSLNVIIGNQNQTGDVIQFAYNKPILETAEKSNTTGGLITLTGNNFLPPNISPVDCNVTISQILCENPIWIDENQISCNVGPGIGNNNQVTITIGGQTNSQNDIKFSYNSPLVETISKSSTQGSEITISGENFVPENIDPLDSNVTISQTLCQNPIWTNENQIICQSPPGIGKDLDITVTIGGLINTDNIKFDYKPPVVNSISKSSTQGSEITISGENFVPENIEPINSSVVVGDNQNCLNIQWESESTIICTAPYGIGLNKVVKVTIGNQENILGRLSYNKPTITASTYTGRSIGSDIITISGTNFIPLELATTTPININNTVLIDNNQCQSITWIDSTKVICVIPPGTGENLNVKVIIGSQESDLNNYFTYDAPHIASISPPKGRMTENTLVTITGNNFGSSATGNSIFIGSSQCTNIVKWVDDEIQCTTPTSTVENSFSVRLIVDSQGSNEDKQFKYYGKPVIQSINANNRHISGQKSVTLIGKNFKELNSDTLVFFKSIQVPITQLNDQEIIFTNVKGGGTNIEIYVRIEPSNPSRDELVSDSNTQFSYDAPNIILATPPTGDKDEETDITITGDNLGLTDDSPSITVNGNDCSNINVESPQSVKCRVPSSPIEGPAIVLLTFHSQSDSINFLYTDDDSSSSGSSSNSFEEKPRKIIKTSVIFPPIPPPILFPIGVIPLPPPTITLPTTMVVSFIDGPYPGLPTTEVIPINITLLAGINWVYPHMDFNSVVITPFHLDTVLTGTVSQIITAYFNFNFVFRLKSGIQWPCSININVNSDRLPSEGGEQGEIPSYIDLPEGTDPQHPPNDILLPPITPSTYESTIKGVLFNDRNFNGIRDSGEEQISGVFTVELDDGNNETIASTSTSSGSYSITTTQSFGYYALQVTQSPSLQNQYFLPQTRFHVPFANGEYIQDIPVFVKSEFGCKGTITTPSKVVHLQYGTFNINNFAIYGYEEKNFTFPDYCRYSLNDYILTISYKNTLDLTLQIDSNLDGLGDSNISEMEYTVISNVEGQTITRNYNYSSHKVLDLPSTSTIKFISPSTLVPVLNNIRFEINPIEILDQSKTFLFFNEIPTIKFTNNPTGETLSLAFGKFVASFFTRIGFSKNSLSFKVGNNQAVILQSPATRIFQTSTDTWTANNIIYGSIEIVNPNVFPQSINSTGGNITIPNDYSYGIPSYSIEGVSLNCTQNTLPTLLDCSIPPYQSGPTTKSISATWNSFELYSLETITYIDIPSENSSSSSQSAEVFSISGTIYHDINSNNQYDIGELVLSGVLVKLNQNVFTSNENGTFEFLNVVPGDYDLYIPISSSNQYTMVIETIKISISSNITQNIAMYKNSDNGCQGTIRNSIEQTIRIQYGVVDLSAYNYNSTTEYNDYSLNPACNSNLNGSILSITYKHSLSLQLYLDNNMNGLLEPFESSNGSTIESSNVEFSFQFNGNEITKSITFSSLPIEIVTDIPSDTLISFNSNSYYNNIIVPVLNPTIVSTTSLTYPQFPLLSGTNRSTHSITLTNEQSNTLTIPFGKFNAEFLSNIGWTETLQLNISQPKSNQIFIIQNNNETFILTSANSSILLNEFSILSIELVYEPLFNNLPEISQDGQNITLENIYWFTNAQVEINVNGLAFECNHTTDPTVICFVPPFQSGPLTKPINLSFNSLESHPTGTQITYTNRVKGYLFDDININNQFNPQELVFSNISVQLVGINNYTTSTRDNGMFAFDNVNPGEYIVFVEFINFTYPQFMIVDPIPITVYQDQNTHQDIPMFALSNNGCQGVVSNALNQTLRLQYGSYNLTVYGYNTTAENQTYTQFADYCNIFTINETLVIEYKSKIDITLLLDSNIDGLLSLSETDLNSTSTPTQSIISFTYQVNNNQITKSIEISSLPTIIHTDIPNDSIISFNSNSYFNNFVVNIIDPTVINSQNLSYTLFPTANNQNNSITLTNNDSITIELPYGKFTPLFFENLGYNITQLNIPIPLSNQQLIITTDVDTIVLNSLTNSTTQIVNVTILSIELLNSNLFANLPLINQTGETITIENNYWFSSALLIEISIDNTPIQCNHTFNPTVDCLIPQYQSGPFTKPIEMKFNNLILHANGNIQYESI